MLSVVIPTRHRNDSLAECLECLAPGVQTLAAEHYEVIVTDDGSLTTAQTMVAERFPWVRWTAGPRRGPAANRNHGLLLVRGDWVAFTDDDCLPDPRWLAAYVATIALVGGADVLEGRTTCVAGLPSVLYEAPVNLSGGHLYSCNMALPKATVQRVGGFDERFPHTIQEDVEFFLRLKASGHRVRFVPDAVVDHPPRRRHLGTTAGRRWQGRVLISYLWPEDTRHYWPSHMLKVRISELRRGGLGLDWLKFAWMTIPELIVIVAHARCWDRQYRSVRPIVARTAPS